MRRERIIHDVMQDDKPQPMKQDKQDKCFDSVKIKYLMFDHAKSVIFPKLESNTYTKLTLVLMVVLCYSNFQNVISKVNN